jgi:hypothetical protein
MGQLKPACCLHNICAAGESAAANAVKKTDIIIDTRLSIIFISPPFFP